MGRGLFISGVASLLLLIGSLAEAQQLGQGEEGIPLAFHMSTNHPQPEPFLMGEPVILYLHLSNFSTKPMRLQVDPTLQAGLRLEVRTPVTRGWTEVQKPTDQAPYQRATIELMPFDTRTYSLLLLYDRENRAIMVRTAPDGTQIPLSLPKLVFDQDSVFRIKGMLAVTVNATQQLNMEAGTRLW